MQGKFDQVRIGEPESNYQGCFRLLAGTRTSGSQFVEPKAVPDNFFSIKLTLYFILLRIFLHNPVVVGGIVAKWTIKGKIQIGLT